MSRRPQSRSSAREGDLVPSGDQAGSSSLMPSPRAPLEQLPVGVHRVDVALNVVAVAYERDLPVERRDTRASTALRATRPGQSRPRPWCEQAPGARRGHRVYSHLRALVVFAVAARGEAVRPVPVPDAVCVDRDLDVSLEPGERSRAARERDPARRGVRARRGRTRHCRGPWKGRCRCPARFGPTPGDRRLACRA